MAFEYLFSFQIELFLVGIGFGIFPDAEVSKGFIQTEALVNFNNFKPEIIVKGILEIVVNGSDLLENFFSEKGGGLADTVVAAEDFFKVSGF